MTSRWKIAGLILFGVGVLASTSTLRAAKKAEPMLGHMVYFTLKEDSPENRDKLVAACHKYLTGHQGCVFYSAGTLADDLAREVNDRDFHVALHLVFDGKEAHDVYQTHQRHLDFIKVAQPLMSKVRVFDSYVTKE